MSPNRRSFLWGFALGASGLFAAGRAKLWALLPGTNAAPQPHGHQAVGAAAASPRAPVVLDRELLRGVAESVLPESLDARARERATGAFEVWLADFQPNAELIHPYGGDAIPYGPPDPEPVWAAQLAQLEDDAQSSHGQPFTELSIGARRELIDARIEDENDGFPAPARARHVAVGLMAHYFGSADATDRVYGVKIEKLECRTLQNVGDLPAPLEE